MAAASALLGLVLIGLQTDAPDSAAVLRRARDEQARFERARRASLPYTTPAGGRVEEQIGRFRFWHDDGNDAAPPELAPVRRARERLLVELELAAAALPADPWVAGQLVRYQIEHDSTGAARAAARRCAAAPWWCRALEGLAAHAAGDYGGAEAAFDAALNLMPGELRCQWTDASLLLAGRFRDRYRRLDCDRRAALDQRLWWLARPLHLLPGNDRRTEHLARMTMTEIQRDARNAYGIRWGRDLAEITVRYGWTSSWSAEPPRLGREELVVVGHQRTPGFRFTPTPNALAEPYATHAADWDLADPAPRERYAPAYADSFIALPHQTAAFRRGESTLVVTAYDLSTHHVFATRPVEVALVLSPDPATQPSLARSAEPAGVLMATAAHRPLLFGIEALSRKGRRAARARYVLPLPSPARVTVSDLLLLHAPDSLPNTLAQAVPHARRSADLAHERRLGMYWETYGLAPGGEPVAISVAVRRLGGGLFRRSVPVRLEWTEWASPAGDGGGGGAARALLLDLSALSPGRYVIELRVDVREQDPVAVAREVRLGP